MTGHASPPERSVKSQVSGIPNVVSVSFDIFTLRFRVDSGGRSVDVCELVHKLHSDIHTDRQTGSQTDRQADIQTYRQTQMTYCYY